MHEFSPSTDITGFPSSISIHLPHMVVPSKRLNFCAGFFNASPCSNYYISPSAPSSMLISQGSMARAPLMFFDDEEVAGMEPKTTAPTKKQLQNYGHFFYPDARCI